MTTINGKPVPASYPAKNPSIDNLPEIIAAIDRIGAPHTIDDGDLKREEALRWLDNFYNEKPPAITPDDIDFARRQSGSPLFMEMTDRQWRDLVRYFRSVFPGFPPYQDNPAISIGSPPLVSAPVQKTAVAGPSATTAPIREDNDVPVEEHNVGEPAWVHTCDPNRVFIAEFNPDEIREASRTLHNHPRDLTVDQLHLLVDHACETQGVDSRGRPYMEEYYIKRYLAEK